MNDSLVIPRSPEIERAVIGQFLFEPTLLDRSDLGEADFQAEPFRRIFLAMKSHSSGGHPIDLPLLSASLSPDDFDILNRISSDAFTAVNFPIHSAKLKELSKKRRLQSLCLETARELSNSNGEAIGRLHRGLSELLSPPPEATLKRAVLDADQMIVMDFPQKEMIVNPFLCAASIVFISGWRGRGKTWLALSLADAITRGTSLGPWPVSTASPCIYIDGEMHIADTQERLRRLDASASTKRVHPFLIYSDHWGVSSGLPKAHLLAPEWQQGILDICKDWSIGVLILDNLSALSPGIDENSKQEFDQISQFLLRLRFQGVSVILVHHTGKSGSQRGTSSHEDHVDVSLNLMQPSDYVSTDGCRFILKFSKARIRDADLSLTADTEFQLKEKNGRLEWAFSGMKKKNKEEILRLFSESIPQKDIPDIIGLSKGQVSKIRTQLVNEGFLSEKGELTVRGEEFLGGS